MLRAWWSTKRWCVLVVALLLVTNAATLCLLLCSFEDAQEFSFLDPKVAEMGVEQFRERQQHYHTEFVGLEQSLRLRYAGGVSIYYEDLKTGAWVGVREQEKFVPGSLLKVPTLIAVMKLVEEGNLSLDSEVLLLEEDVDDRFGFLWVDGSGYSMNVAGLMNLSTSLSDNTADRALRRQLAPGDFAEAMLSSGIPYTTEVKDGVMELSPKDYANVFRSLYYSGYLKRSGSDYVLSLLAHTRFDKGLPAGVPSSVMVSHKIGAWKDGGQYHDCGIVYVPGKPYLLCVMMDGVDAETSFEVTEQVSRDVYAYVKRYWEDGGR